MKREIKFRSWDNKNKKFVSIGFHVIGEVTMFGTIEQYCFETKSKEQTTLDRLGDIEIEQFTGLIDKNGKEIYEGDIIKFKRPYRSTQTHTGDNIPNGSYTEPMEPEIRTEIFSVEFCSGIFGINTGKPIFNEMASPLVWECETEFDEEGLKYAISYGGKDIFDWYNGADGDLDYLLDEYGYKSVDELLADISGIEIIGNIHENHELL
jgi:uncharacterized phage protein (TIGR01671 family)